MYTILDHSLILCKRSCRKDVPCDQIRSDQILPYASRTTCDCNLKDRSWFCLLYGLMQFALTFALILFHFPRSCRDADSPSQYDVVPIARAAIHSNYKPKNQQNDIGLIWLAAQSPRSKQVQLSKSSPSEHRLDCKTFPLCCL